MTTKIHTLSSPLVSVCLAVYNQEKYLRQCLESLVNQTLQNLEIVVVNDASPDNSRSIIHEFAARYQSIIVIENPQNLGLLKSREVALDAARGEYVAFMDADDWVNLEMYEKMYTKAVNTVADVVVCGFYEMYFKVNSHGDEILTKKTRADNTILAKADNRYDILLGNSYFLLQVKLWRRGIILQAKSEINFDAGIFFGEDLLITGILYFHVKKGVCVYEPLVFYRVLSNKPYRLQDEILDVEVVYTHFLDLVINQNPRYLKSLCWRITISIRNFLLKLYQVPRPRQAAKDDMRTLSGMSQRLYGYFRHSPWRFWPISCTVWFIKGLKLIYCLRLERIFHPVIYVLLDVLNNKQIKFFVKKFIFLK